MQHVAVKFQTVRKFEIRSTPLYLLPKIVKLTILNSFVFQITSVYFHVILKTFSVHCGRVESHEIVAHASATVGRVSAISRRHLVQDFHARYVNRSIHSDLRKIRDDKGICKCLINLLVYLLECAFCFGYLKLCFPGGTIYPLENTGR